MDDLFEVHLLVIAAVAVNDAVSQTPNIIEVSARLWQSSRRLWRGHGSILYNLEGPLQQLASLRNLFASVQLEQMVIEPEKCSFANRHKAEK
ncbi:MAG TPA: hypothetical protein VGF08_10110 [Terriglobales bacterium]